MKINRSDYSRFQDYGVYTPKRVIYLGSDKENGEDIDGSSARNIIKNLLFLDSINKKMITIYINTPGGCWFNGMGIYDTIKFIKSPVKIIGTGQVMSMGTVIFQACRYRYLLPNCTFMIHDGSDGYGGVAKNFEAWGDYSKEIRQKMYEIYLSKIIKKHKKYTIKKVEELCTHDNIMSSEMTVKIGLADKVIK